MSLCLSVTLFPTAKPASPGLEAAESSEAKPEKEGTAEATGEATGEGNEGEMAGVVEEGGGGKGKEEGEGGGKGEGEGERAKPMEETGEQAQARYSRTLDRTAHFEA